MRLTRFIGENIRNIKDLDISPGSSVNVIVGPNGAGKTAFLEGLYLLGNGKSFRTNRFADLVRAGQERVAARGEFEDETNPAQKHSVKVFKTRTATSILVNESNVSNASSLTRLVPMLLVEASSFGIVEGGPRVRRALIDRAAFHVEPDFLFNYRALVDALEQRNALLKSSTPGSSQIQFWDEKIENCADRITEIRQNCVANINELLSDSTRTRFEPGAISLRYRRGWAAGRSLAEVLRENRQRDISAGTTSEGPQRAEIEVLLKQALAARVASRGQIKSIVVSIVCALIRLVASRRGDTPMLLLDDIAAELDEIGISLALDSIRDTGAQVFLTAINDNVQPRLDRLTDRAFHVEHGFVAETASMNR